MKHDAWARSTRVLALQAACLVPWLSGCAAYPDKHFFDPQDSREFDQPLSAIQPCVPSALERLGVTVERQEPGQGKLSLYASSASGLEVLVQLEAMTTRKTQLAVWVYGYTNFGDWLASEIADAIEVEVSKATEGAADQRFTRGGHDVQIDYLEIVTNDVDGVCAVYTAANGLQFGEPDAGLGNARTAPLPGGALLGVRAPLRDSEEPVVRPYWLVDDIEAAVAAAVDAGAEVAHPPLEIPGHGTFAIYFVGGVQHGLWQR
jgi:hypothetical protein